MEAGHRVRRHWRRIARRALIWRCVSLCFVLLGLIACTSVPHGPIRAEPIPSPGAIEPELRTDAPSGQFVASHVLMRDEAWYADGPQQARPPDGVLLAGTRVRLLQTDGSYSVVEMSGGKTAHVTTGSLKPL